MPQKKSSNAAEIIRRRYVGNETGSLEQLEKDKLNAEIAETIFRLRTDAGLTQGQLAERIGTTQSVISRLEDAEYDGHSLSVLNRIAGALDQEIQLALEPRSEDARTVRMAFREVLRKLRLDRGFTVEQAASRLGVSPKEVLSLEQSGSYRPSPLLLHKISSLYDIPQQRLAVLAGAVREVPDEMREQASRFAAMSESFSKLTPEEKRQLDAFVKFLRRKL